MKKTILSLFVLAMLSTNIFAQKNTESNFFVSANAHALIDSYRDLIAIKNTGDLPYAKDNITGNRRCVAGSMPGKGYGGAVSGYVTFTSYYWFEYSFGANPLNLNNNIVNTSFHTHWYSPERVAALFGSDKGNEIYIPKPIVLNGTQTQNYSVLLVPIKAYQNSGLKDASIQMGIDKDYIDSPLVNIAINTTEVKAINDVYLEGQNGYMSKNLSTNYNNLYSSIGLIVEVQLKNGDTKKCYVFNNYEVADSRFAWKNMK
jgi:hypothetical protein